MREPLGLVEKICLAFLGTVFIAALSIGGYVLYETQEQVTELQEQVTELEESLSRTRQITADFMKLHLENQHGIIIE